MCGVLALQNSVRAVSDRTEELTILQDLLTENNPANQQGFITPGKTTVPASTVLSGVVPPHPVLVPPLGHRHPHVGGEQAVEHTDDNTLHSGQ